MSGFRDRRNPYLGVGERPRPVKAPPSLSIDPAPAAPSGVGRRVRMDPAVAALAALMVVTGAAKFAFSASHPLSLDELWTGMIASQRSPAGLLRQCYLDVNAPLGYVLTWTWAHLAGLSDWALRFPSVVFASATPLLA